MQLARQKQVHKFSYVPEVEMVLLAFLSMVVVQSFRTPSHRWVPGLLLETIVFLVVPLLFFVFFTRQLPVCSDQSKHKPTVFWLQGGALIMALLVLLTQWLSRQGGLGDANEIVALLVVQSVAWYLAVFSRFGSFNKVAFLLSGSLVLFVCFMAEQTAVFATALLFALIALWWLLGNYWNRLNIKALDADSRTLPINGFAMTLTVILLSLIGWIAWILVPPNTVTSVGGFSPFSGGKDGIESDFARAGFGDGNMLTAGENATTAGAVDSDQFIEDDKPSIYDITSDKYDGPLMIKKQKNRAVSLDAKAKHLHEVIQSEQAGKVFRTVRESPNPKELDLENRITEALFYVEGSVPARFGIDSFQYFDGWDWSKKPLDSDTVLPAIRVENHMGVPWYVIRSLEKKYLPVTRPHRVKMMRLKSNVIPAGSFLKGWHIHKVEDPRMFFWNEVGLIRMDGDFIPGQTLIDVVSHVPNYHLLRSSKNVQLVDRPKPQWEKTDSNHSESETNGRTRITDQAGSTFLQIPDNKTKPRVSKLAQTWTQGQTPGWNQVEAIVNRMRDDFILSPLQTAPADGTDTVGAFLDQGAGPSYLFATTATQILRAAGYRTRLVTGFLVEKKHYDRVANQSEVTAENVHMWPEVCLDGWHWIPVEPTPGFPIPYSHQTIWQWAKAQIVGIVQWIINRPALAILLAISSFCLIRFRRLAIASNYWLLWLVAGSLRPNRNLALTRKLIDVRFWAAGLPRPSFAPVSEWFSQIDSEIGKDFFRFWQIQNYRTRPIDKEKHPEIATACRDIVSQLSFRRIRTFLKHSHRKSPHETRNH